MFSSLIDGPGVVHSRFGDLARGRCVTMENGFRPEASFGNFAEDDRIMIHLTVTGRCYAQCQGCINSAVTLGCDQPRNHIVLDLESRPERDVSIIQDLVSGTPDRECVLCFYGGEPFLVPDIMDAVRRGLEGSRLAGRLRYMVYTNGELLIEAYRRNPDLVRGMWLYSVSIDGDEAQHNRVRVGTRYGRIIENLRFLREVYSGNVLQWSTLRESQSLGTCFETFLELYGRGLVNHFFWHWSETREPFADFPAYAAGYGSELEQVVGEYTERLFRGEVLPIAHLNELVLFLLTGTKRGHTACGVELARNFDIVAGRVHACADLPACLVLGEHGPEGGPDLCAGDLGALVLYKDHLGCYECGVHAYCGGRCPVQALAGSPLRTLQYCQLMRLHVGIVKERIDEIEAGLSRMGVTAQDLYDRFALLSRYTDVVP